MNDFEKFAYDEICTALADIDVDILPDIYVLSFYIFDLDDDPRHPILQVGYNTRSRALACTPAAGQAPRWPIASNAGEAKWNYAFWLQNELTFIGEPDTQGERLLQESLKAQGLWYSDEDEEADFDRCTPIANDISAEFMAACARIAQALHASGIIEKRFTRPIPIIVHRLDYYDEITACTTAANPPGLAHEFSDWVSGLGRPQA
jgi:hypothetical protein